MSAETSEPTPVENFYDVIQADPAVGSCSILASQIYATAVERTRHRNDLTYEKSLQIAGEQGISSLNVSYNVRVNELATTGKPLLVAQEGYDTYSSRHVLAEIRGGMHIQLARIAIEASGPCNYVQFPGEISDNQVYTPMEEAERRPLLKSLMEHISVEGSLARFHSGSKPGAGLEMAEHADKVPDRYSYLYEAITGPDELIGMTQGWIRIAWKDIDIYSLDEEENTRLALVMAYAKLVGRYEIISPNLPLRPTYSDDVLDSTFWPKLGEISEAIKPADGKVGSLPEGIQDTALGQYVRTRYELIMDPYLADPLSELFSSQFLEIFGLSYEPERERILGEIMKNTGHEYTLVIKSAANTAAGDPYDIEYVLTIDPDEDPEVITMNLTARVTTMFDVEPTPYGGFILQKTGDIYEVKSSKTDTPLSGGSLTQLDNILTNGTKTPLKPKEAAVEVIQISPAHRRWFSR